MEKSAVEQRICLKFCVANGISCVKSLEMLRKAFGESCMSKSRTYEWYKSFKEGRETVEDASRSGRPATSKNDRNIGKIKQLLHDKPDMSIRQLSQKLNISKASVHSILTDVLGMSPVAVKKVYKIPSNEKVQTININNDDEDDEK